MNDPRLQQPANTDREAPTACPSCGAAMPVNAVFCVACGFDSRTGQRLARTLATSTDGDQTGKEEVEWGACYYCKRRRPLPWCKVVWMEKLVYESWVCGRPAPGAKWRWSRLVSYGTVVARQVKQKHVVIPRCRRCTVIQWLVAVLCALGVLSGAVFGFRLGGWIGAIVGPGLGAVVVLIVSMIVTEVTGLRGLRAAPHPEVSHWQKQGYSSVLRPSPDDEVVDGD